MTDMFATPSTLRFSKSFADFIFSKWLLNKQNHDKSSKNDVFLLPWGPFKEKKQLN